MSIDLLRMEGRMKKALTNFVLSALLVAAGITGATLFLSAQGAPKDCTNLSGCTGMDGCVAYYWQSAPACKIWCYAKPPDGHPGTIQCEVINP
jgi:hypothetical protein